METRGGEEKARRLTEALDEIAQALEKMDEAKPREIHEDSRILAPEPNALQINQPITSKERVFFAVPGNKGRQGGAAKGALSHLRSSTAASEKARVCDDREEAAGGAEFAEEWDTCVDKPIGSFDDEGNFIVQDEKEQERETEEAPPSEGERQIDQEKEKIDKENENEWTVVRDKQKKKPGAYNQKSGGMSYTAKQKPIGSKDVSDKLNLAAKTSPPAAQEEAGGNPTEDSDSEGFVLVKEKKPGRGHPKWK